MLQKLQILFRDQLVLRHPCDNFPFLQFSPFPEVEREGGNDNYGEGLMVLYSLPKEPVHTKHKRLIKDGVSVYLSGRCCR